MPPCDAVPVGGVVRVELAGALGVADLHAVGASQCDSGALCSMKLLQRYELYEFRASKPEPGRTPAPPCGRAGAGGCWCRRRGSACSAPCWCGPAALRILATYSAGECRSNITYKSEWNARRLACDTCRAQTPPRRCRAPTRRTGPSWRRARSPPPPPPWAPSSCQPRL
jgi:hypothetical protein